MSEPRDPFAEHLPPLGDPERDAFLAMWREVDAGGSDLSSLAQRARDLSLDAPLLPERAALPEADRVPEIADLVRIATDVEPDIASDAPDRLFGPWASLAKPSDLAAAVALACLWPSDPASPLRSPLERWGRAPGLPRRDRASLLSLLRAPPAPYRLLAVEQGRLGATVTIEPLFDLGAACPGPVAFLPAVATPSGGLRATGGLFARVIPVRDPTGELRFVALPAVALRDPRPPERWLALATWLSRLRSRTTVQTIPDVLRVFGGHLLRRTLERDWP